VIIRGILPVSLIDYPDEVSTVLFTGGCNWRCTYCHNKHLWATTPALDINEVLTTLVKRRKLVTHIVISGGEPTIHPTLEEFIRKLKELNFFVKLDTNGSNPHILQKLIEQKLLDYIEMDVKGPIEKYPTITNADVNIADILRSIRVIASSNIPHRFRTVYLPEFTTHDIEATKKLIPPSSSHIINEYKSYTA